MILLTGYYSYEELNKVGLESFGENVLISWPQSCMDCGRMRPFRDCSFSVTKGAISVVMNNTFLAFILYYFSMIVYEK